MPYEDKATGTDSILVVTDRFSGYTLAIPHRKDDGAHELAKLMVRHVYEVFGLPRVLLSDHDPKFASDLFKKVHERMGWRQNQNQKASPPNAAGGLGYSRVNTVPILLQRQTRGRLRDLVQVHREAQ